MRSQARSTALLRRSVATIGSSRTSSAGKFAAGLPVDGGQTGGEQYPRSGVGHGFRNAADTAKGGLFFFPPRTSAVNLGGALLLDWCANAHRQWWWREGHEVSADKRIV